MIYHLTQGAGKAEIEEILQGGEYENYATGKINPTGWVYDSMICALNCFFETDNFEAAAVRSANLGGDADTIAAITGGLAGALYGYEAIPERWTTALEPATCTMMDKLAQAALDHACPIDLVY